jgi:hypothetical protein
MSDFATIFYGIRDSMEAKGLPKGWFTYGPPQVPQTRGATRLFLCVDEEAGDAILPARAQRRNPQHVGVRALGFKVSIYAHSTREGADMPHHEGLAVRLANMVHVAIEHLTKQEGTLTMWRPTRVGFVTLPSTDGWAGRLYEFRFQLDVAIDDVTYVGDAAREVSPEAAGTTTLDPDGPVVNPDLPNVTTTMRAN